MARRAVASATPNRASSNVSFRDTPVLQIPDETYNDNIRLLRRNWKWAAFSQFFYTFATLLNMSDEVKLTDIEDDLARGTGLFIPRLMQRLLYTVSQDRKVNLDNWQSRFRREYLRRDPEANPLGIEPPAPSRRHSREPTAFSEPVTDLPTPAVDGVSAAPTPLPDGTENEVSSTNQPFSPAAESTHSGEVDEKGPSVNGDAVKQEEAAPEQSVPPPDEPKDWFELPLLTKLDSLHRLIEWQFQNPHRLRQFMKDDGDHGLWRIEPIGYDAKLNAYWLIGADRLWIQRSPPKPPRPPRTARKRKAPAKAPAKPSTSKVESDVDSEPELEEEPSSKRRRTTRSSGRSTRSKAKEDEGVTAGRGTRAAKLRANKMLDKQAKELAEYQRQAALLDTPRSSHGRSTRQTRESSSRATPSRRGAVGTRASARLRGKESDDDDEWQQIPDEWLNEAADSESKEDTIASRRTRRKSKVVPPTPARVTRSTRSRGKAKVVDESEEEEEEEEDMKHLAEQAGLESDGESSALTSLSDEEQNAKETNAEEENEVDGENEDDAEDETSTKQAKDDEEEKENEHMEEDGETKDDDGEKESEEPTATTTDATPAEDAQDEPAHEETPARKSARNSRRKGARGSRRKSGRTKSQAAATVQVKPVTKTELEEDVPERVYEAPQAPFPPGFIEWEAIAVTLYEWEHVTDPFEHATNHYEKALYKVLSADIVPYIVEELREAEKKRRIEEAVVHRKRSSRIALKEHEKQAAIEAAKKKAEDDEKMARVRRAEARARKEEEAREAREKAREQRRLEREERERARDAQRERESAEVDVITLQPAPTPAPATNGHGHGHAHGHGDKRHVSQTPTAGKSPDDWILDCEICKMSGRNLDDGLPMVCCNACGRWQHIRCHDKADSDAGRPQRNWRTGQFYCARCRPAYSRVISGDIHLTRPVSSYVYAHAPSHKAIAPRLGGPGVYQQPTSDMRYSSQYPQAYQNGSVYHQQYGQNSMSAQQVPYARSTEQGHSQAQPNVGFSHYQPDQGAFSRTAQMSPSIQSSASWQGGYPMTNGSSSSQPSIPVSHYSQSGMYNGGRVASPYQYQPSPQQQPYGNRMQEPTTPVSNGSWANTSNEFYQRGINAGQLSTSQLNAAESLAFLQRSGGSSQGWQNGGAQSAQPQQNNGYPQSIAIPPVSSQQLPPS